MTVLEEEMNLYALQMDIPSSIARNQALVENIFAIVVCFENKIPLIIIGPPGNVYLPFVWRVNIGAKPASFQEARKLFLLILWPITCAVRILSVPSIGRQPYLAYADIACFKLKIPFSQIHLGTSKRWTFFITNVPNIRIPTKSKRCLSMV